jgi:hypothetical protein
MEPRPRRVMRDARYFVAPDGVRYRVLDAAMSNGRTVIANPPVSWATIRLFRPKEGHRRIYTFAPGEARSPTDEALERQLRSAGYLPTQKYDPSERTAR